MSSLLRHWNLNWIEGNYEQTFTLLKRWETLFFMIIVFFSTFMIFSTSGTLYLGSGWYLVGEPLPRSSCGNWNWSRKRIGSIYRRLFVLILIVSLTRQTHLPRESWVMTHTCEKLKLGLKVGWLQEWCNIGILYQRRYTTRTNTTQQEHNGNTFEHILIKLKWHILHNTDSAIQ